MSPPTAHPTLLGHRLEGERGEVILLLNGSMMTFPSWAVITSGLHDRHRTLGCDFRGQLRSPGRGHQRLADHVADLVTLLDHLALDRVHVLGASFGGEIAVLLAASQPRRVRSLAVVTAADRTPPGMPEDARRLQAAARRVLEGGDAGVFHDALVDGLYSDGFRRLHAQALAERRAKVAELPTTWFEGLDGILTSVQSFDLTSVLPDIRCPTLVVHAAADAMMPAERVRALAEGIAEAELQTHPSSGHGLVIEDPAWLIAVYRDFLHRRGTETP